MRILWWMNKQLDKASDKAYIATLSNHLSRIGCDVVVVARYEKVKESYAADIRYLWTLPVKYLRNASYFVVSFFSCMVVTSREHPDVLVVDRPPLVFSMLPLVVFRRFFPRLRDVKIVLDVRSLPNRIGTGMIGTLNLLWFKMAMKMAGRYFDGCMAITPAMANYISQHSRFRSDQIGIWSSAFDSDLFNPENATPEVWDRIDEVPVVIYHGALAHNRMLKELILAVQRVQTPVQLFILGGGPMEGELRRMIETGPSTHRITLHPPVAYEKVPGYLNAASIGIVPIPDTLWFEVSMPIKLLEYMAMGLTVIAPLTEPVKNVIGDAECDVIRYATDTSTDAVAALMTALSEAVSRTKTGDRSSANRNLVLAKFTWNEQARSIKAYLEYIATPIV